MLQAVDLLLMKWDSIYRNLTIAEATYQANGETKRPRHKLGCCGCSGAARFFLVKQGLPLNLGTPVRNSALPCKRQQICIRGFWALVLTVSRMLTCQGLW